MSGDREIFQGMNYDFLSWTCSSRSDNMKSTSILSSFPPRPDFESSHCSSAEFTYPPSEIDMSSQSGSPLTLFPSYSSTGSESSGASVFSDISSQSESSCSSVYGEITPCKTAGQTALSLRIPDSSRRRQVIRRRSTYATLVYPGCVIRTRGSSKVGRLS